MKSLPLPPNTPSNIAGAIGDVLRAGAAWGADTAKGEPTEQAYQMCMQFLYQALSIIYQREPTPEEVEACFRT